MSEGSASDLETELLDLLRMGPETTDLLYQMLTGPDRTTARSVPALDAVLMAMRDAKHIQSSKDSEGNIWWYLP